MDLILALNPKTGNFFQLVPQGSTSSTSVQKFIVDSFITSALLKEIIYYAYNRKCTLTEQNSVSIADFAAKYGIDSLVQYCLDYLMNHVSVNNVIKGFELADMDRFVNVTARTFFQSFIEDHLEQVCCSFILCLLVIRYPHLYHHFVYRFGPKTKTIFLI